MEGHPARPRPRGQEDDARGAEQHAERRRVPATGWRQRRRHPQAHPRSTADPRGCSKQRMEPAAARVRGAHQSVRRRTPRPAQALQPRAPSQGEQEERGDEAVGQRGSRAPPLRPAVAGTDVHARRRGLRRQRQRNETDRRVPAHVGDVVRRARGVPVQAGHREHTDGTRGRRVRALAQAAKGEARGGETRSQGAQAARRRRRQL